MSRLPANPASSPLDVLALAAPGQISPGPWRLEDTAQGERHLIAACGAWIATLHGGYGTADNDNADDNEAQIIAALPEFCAAVAELVAKSERVTRTLELAEFVKPSAKNANAGFVDMRDWFALKGEVMELRAALAKFGGGV